MSVSFSGLASGIDTTSLVTSLVAAAKAPETQLQSHQSDLHQQKSILGDLEARLAGLASAAQQFDLGFESTPMTATQSDSTHVSVAVSGAAAAATHAIRVIDTARAQVVSSKTFASAAAGVLGDGSETFKRAGQPDVTVSWTSADSLATIADRITQAGAGVSASVLFDGTKYRLLVGANATGTAAAATFAETGDALGLADPSNITVPAKDAVVSIDGVTVTRGKNVIDDALPGMTITALSKQAVTDPDTSVQVGIDAGATRGTVQQVVGAFNAVASAISSQLNYTGTAPGSNTLFGDSTLQGLQRALGDLVTGPSYGPALAKLGVALGRDGQLTLDQTKFDAALAADPGAVKDLFAAHGAVPGFGKALENLNSSYTRPGDGVLVAKSAGMDARVKVYQDQLDLIERSTTALQNRLNETFTNLEMTMSKLKASSTYLASLTNKSNNG